MSEQPIIIISSEFPPGPGGIGKHAYDLARALSNEKENIVVMATQDYAADEQIKLFNSGNSKWFKFIKLERSGIMTYLNRWILVRKTIKNNSPKRIIVSGRFSLWLGYLIKLAYKSSIPVDAFIHGSEFTVKNKFFLLLTKIAIDKMDNLFSVSNHTSLQLHKLLPHKYVSVIPNGLWLEDWDRFLNSKAISQETISLLTVGRLSLRKGQHRVIKALPVILDKYPSLSYYMAGIPHNKNTLIEIARKLGVENAINIYGKIESHKRLCDIYEKHDIFIMLSETQKSGDTEGFGIAILEANYFGKPAIGALGSGIEDAIKNGYNGILVDGDNAKEITKAIEEIYNNYEQYSANAVKWAEQHDWKKIINNYKGLVETKSIN